MKIYILKDRLNFMVRPPLPQFFNMGNYYVVDIPDDFELTGKRYDPETGGFVADDTTARRDFEDSKVAAVRIINERISNIKELLSVAGDDLEEYTVKYRLLILYKESLLTSTYVTGLPVVP